MNRLTGLFVVGAIAALAFACNDSTAPTYDAQCTTQIDSALILFGTPTLADTTIVHAGQKVKIGDYTSTLNQYNVFVANYLWVNITKDNDHDRDDKHHDHDTKIDSIFGVWSWQSNKSQCLVDSLYKKTHTEK